MTSDRQRIGPRQTPTIRLPRALAVLAVLALAGGGPPASAQGADCDCSCEAFAAMTRVMEEARAAAREGHYDAMPPEVADMARCGGTCAMQWAQCASPDAELDGRAPSAATGGPPSPAVDLQQLRRDRDAKARAEPEPPGLPKTRLTPDYLEGTWCSVYGGQETTQWSFDAEGRYRIGVPAGGRYAMQPEVQSLEHFRARFERLIERESDGFTTVHEHGRKNVFTRGPCG